MFLEGTLLEKLRKIEALHAGTKVDGEREAARRAASAFARASRSSEDASRMWSCSTECLTRGSASCSWRFVGATG